MRIAIPTILILAMATVAMPARAQTYDPTFPVCLHVYGPTGYFQCRYFSLRQCAISASGRAAQCVVNPYFANDGFSNGRNPRHYRRAY
ncbi:MAG: DUF3551 domain-containing protein [Bradyrhizobium sp.]|uniref:DUF3551 domain-containing protein n=1 Tax=Bradyrhizobium sp. TaxID=376 RepID=UPI001C28FC86|nr:DUF3551 domain-containing protein [Bradyrhizobium sp.]MBU6461869.1 DUF3551 domain-containing protein [Pseudomonadota bacterium]MDE2069328.1 DUF3551 domain-containing protein [Bradyrhizobium sp.]MDE2473408.1 DUF3551 domain-containing protein [Bradyrhizobium sp.]